MSTTLSKPARPAGLQSFFVTYGIGSHLAGCFSEIWAKDVEKARKLAFKTTQGKHAFLYAERDWELLDQRETREVPLQPQHSMRPWLRGRL
jgi:hypothetical protein